MNVDGEILLACSLPIRLMIYARQRTCLERRQLQIASADGVLGPSSHRHRWSYVLVKMAKSSVWSRTTREKKSLVSLIVGSKLRSRVAKHDREHNCAPTEILNLGNK